MPIDPGTKFESTFKIGSKVLNKAYSRSYYLLMNDNKKYEAYILTIIADSGYVKNDLSKLAHNTYRNQDVDFSGLALYFTPKGNYLGGYAYKNGQIVVAIATEQTERHQVQSVDNGKLRPNDMVITCLDWYDFIYVNDVFSYSEYTGTTCTFFDNGGGTGTSPGTGGSGGTTTPPPCPPSAPPPVSNSINGSHLTVNFIPPPNPCTPAVPVIAKIIDDLKDPCLKFVLENKLIKNNLSGKIADIIHDVFGSSDKVNITFKEENNSAHAYPAITTGTSSTSGIFNATTTLNLAQVGSGSQEYKAIVMVHEVLHAFMDYNQPFKTQLQQHKEIAQKYVNDIRVFVKGLYPTLTDNDAYAMILNGISDIYDNNLQNPNYIALINSYKIVDLSGSFLLQKEGITGTSCTPAQ